MICMRKRCQSIERLHALDVVDVKEMLRRNLIEPERLMELFETIVPMLYRFPAISPVAFRRNLDMILSQKDQPS